MSMIHDLYIYVFLFLEICIFILGMEEERERERERKRNTNVREKHEWVASYMCPNWQLNPQPRYVPEPGIELPTFWLYPFWDNTPTN